MYNHTCLKIQYQFWKPYEYSEWSWHVKRTPNQLNTSIKTGPCLIKQGARSQSHQETENMKGTLLVNDASRIEATDHSNLTKVKLMSVGRTTRTMAANANETMFVELGDSTRPTRYNCRRSQECTSLHKKNCTSGKVKKQRVLGLQQRIWLQTERAIKLGFHQPTS